MLWGTKWKVKFLEYELVFLIVSLRENKKNSHIYVCKSGCLVVGLRRMTHKLLPYTLLLPHCRTGVGFSHTHTDTHGTKSHPGEGNGVPDAVGTYFLPATSSLLCLLCFRWGQYKRQVRTSHETQITGQVVRKLPALSGSVHYWVIAVSKE